MREEDCKKFEKFGAEWEEMSKACVIKNLDLSGVCLENSKFKGTFFINPYFEGAWFVNTDLRGAYFKDVKLRQPHRYHREVARYFRDVKVNP